MYIYIIIIIVVVVVVVVLKNIILTGDQEKVSWRNVWVEKRVELNFRITCMWSCMWCGVRKNSYEISFKTRQYLYLAR